MDINNILSKIENYKAAIAERAEQERVAAKHHHTQLLDQIQVMKPDIDNLIKVANAAREAGIPIQVKFPNTNFTYENGDFMADAMTHKIGFIPSSLTSERIIGIGFEGGGYCGNYDFFTDGQAILDRNRDNGCDNPASTEHLEKFIEKFPEFEKAFYDYIESRNSLVQFGRRSRKLVEGSRVFRKRILQRKNLCSKKCRRKNGLQRRR